MRRGVGDLVPMPLPTQWGPAVIPPGTPPLPTLPAGSQVGYVQVNGGWVLAVQAANGQVTPVPGAPIVAYPGAVPNAQGQPEAVPDSGYLGGDMSYPNGYPDSTIRMGIRPRAILRPAAACWSRIPRRARNLRPDQPRRARHGAERLCCPIRCCLQRSSGETPCCGTPSSTLTLTTGC